MRPSAEDIRNKWVSLENILEAAIFLSRQKEYEPALRRYKCKERITIIMSFDLDRDDQDLQVAMDIHRRGEYEGNAALRAEFFSASGVHS